MAVAPVMEGQVHLGKRPAHIRPPAYLSKSPPVPAPASPDAQPQRPAGAAADRPEPTRYGDWERNGIAIDF